VFRGSLACAAAGLAVVGAACGNRSGHSAGTQGTPPRQYATAVCGAAKRAVADSQAHVAAAQARLGPSPTPRHAKRIFVEFSEAGVRIGKTLVSAIHAAGPPAIPQGVRIQRDLEDAFGQIEKTFVDLGRISRSLPTNDPAAFKRRMRKIQALFDDRALSFDWAFYSLGTRYDVKALDRAFANVPACRVLTRAGS
jgi:hypothetical protein